MEMSSNGLLHMDATPSSDSDRQPAETDQHSDAAFSSLLAKILQVREQQATQALINDPECLPLQSSVGSWWGLFAQGFLLTPANSHSAHGPRDDLLFFVNKQQAVGSKSALRVLRRNSPNLPAPGDPSVNWEQTVYLNLLMQYFSYVATVAVCTRTGPQEVQILKKFSETVYASPSRRRMDSKGTREDVVYPNLFFSVENYNELFSECTLRDSECLCVELTAYDLSGRLQGVCFLGTIQYGSLKKFYDSKTALSSRLDTATMLKRQFGALPNCPNINEQSTRGSTVKFMKVLGPHGKGQAEFAVSLIDEPVTCRCAHTSGLSLMNRCCSCRAGSPRDKVTFEILEHEPITQQPKGAPDNLTPGWQSNEVFADWVSLSVPPEDGGLLRSVDYSSFTPLRSVPSFVQSAGGSTETSPVRRWRMPSLADRASVTSLTGIGATSNYRNGLARPHGSHHFRSNAHKHSPRVSKILEKFVNPEPTTNNSEHTGLSVGVQGAGIDVDLLVGDSANKSIDPDGVQVIFHRSDNPNADGCVLFHGPERNKRSFGQSWSWFKERRRITSPALNAALTSLSLPSYNILTDLIEVRREPILNISD